jgi:putative membrane protein
MARTRFTHLLLAAFIVVAMLPSIAHAHAGRAAEPHDLWSAWTFAPAVLVVFAFAAWLYARGVHALWRSAGVGRGVTRWRVACFVGGMLAAALALLSPLDGISAALFSAHMTQHMLLIVVAAPLFVLGDFSTATLWALRVDQRRQLGLAWHRARTARAIWRQLRRPLVAWLLHVGTLWLWHVPRFYDAALRNEGIHVAEHASFFLTALLFWWIVADRLHGRLGVGVATLYLFTAALQCTLLGALISLARHPWYVAHFGTTAAWGLSPLEDQQLAGLIMWIPAGFAYVLAMIACVLPALRTPDRAPLGASDRTSAQWITPTVAGVSARGTP